MGWNRFKNSEAVSNPKWRCFQIAMVLMFVYLNIHFEWHIPGLGIAFIGSMIAIYISAVLISLREKLTGSAKRQREQPHR